MTDKKFISILDEMDTLMPETRKHRMVEARGEQIISSTVNLLEDIRKNFNESEYKELKKKILNAIRAEDSSKFINKVRSLEKK